MREDLYEHLYRVEDRHWWYVGKRQIVDALLTRFLPPTTNGARPRVADLGCGCGAMLVHLKDRYDVLGVDPSPQAREFCAQRGVEVSLGHLPDGIDLPAESFDAVLLLDVLEHLEDDFASARGAARLLKPGGVMICTSPAYQWLWSDWDQKHYHKRRYSLAGFVRLFTEAGLSVESASYANTALFPLAATARLTSRLIGRRGAGETRVPIAPVNATFRGVFASERHVHGRLKLPFGLSVLAVARKGGQSPFSARS
jgi:SAM-dependent methyltransferase